MLNAVSAAAAEEEDARSARATHQVMSAVVMGAQAGLPADRIAVGEGHAPRRKLQMGFASAPLTSPMVVSGNAGTKPPPGRTYFRMFRISAAHAHMQTQHITRDTKGGKWCRGQRLAAGRVARVRGTHAPSLSPGSWPPNWLQGKPSTVKLGLLMDDRIAFRPV